MFKKALTIIITLFIFSFSVVLMGNEPAKNYFPGTLGSFWVYEDQDGNEFTRHAIEREEIVGKTFAAFSYEPELEDWIEYSPFISPSLYKVSDAGITLVVGDEVEKAVKARLSKEMESVREIFTIQQPDDADFNYEIKAEAHKHSYLLPTPIVLNEEWDVNQIKASLALDLQGNEQLTIDYTINETGIIRGTETVETAAGSFEGCLKVEYRTETTAIITPIPSPDEVDPPGETVTTVWFAPNVGIVKFNQKMNYTFLDMIKDDGGLEKPPDPEPKTFELKKYEIKTAEPEIKTAVPDSDDNNLGNESDSKYFPDALDSFWVYEDQDGNELTRRAIEGEEIAGQTFAAFSYEPELEDWAEYSPFIQPFLYNVSDAGITLVVSDEVEKAVKARLSKEMESFREIIIRSDDPDAANFTYNILKAEAHKHSYLLPTPVVLNEEWDVNQIKASLALGLLRNVTIDYTINETGIIRGTETIKTAAGTFEDCLKVEYRTETTIQLNPPDPETNPPGETITTVWFAPGVGIAKFHQKMKYTFLEIIPDDADLPIPPDPEPKTFELKKYEIKTAEPEIKTAVPDSDDSNLGNESDSKYFPDALDSFWVYEDQDGNELTRRAIEGEEVAGKTFSAFSYEPELKDWAEYSPFIQPSLYNVSDAGITLVVGDEVEKAVKARLSKEMESFREIIRRDDPDSANFTYNIEVEAQDNSNLLPTPVTLNEEWDTNEIKASLALIFEGEEQIKIDYTIMETGIVKGTETVVAAAGTFEDCLKVEYRTETTAVLDLAELPDEMDPPGEIVTTVWFAPDVGIVKFHQKMNYMFFDMFQDEFQDDGGLEKPPDPEPKTFELKKYEIKTAEPKIKTAVPDSDDSNLGNESDSKYFPDALDSFWVYEDQDGNELTRRAIEGEEIAGQTFAAFSYEPELKDWAEYSPFISPSLYNVSDAGITLVVGDEVEKAVKARLSKEMEYLREIIRDDPDVANFTYNILKAEAHKHSYLLPTPVVLNEEWDVNQIKASLALGLLRNVTIDYTINETGIIRGTETIKTAAGTFEDCLKVEYRTETTAVLDPVSPPDEIDPPGETVTTVWFAPNVGIVKFYQKMKYTFLEMIPDDADLPIPPDPITKTLVLKKYEIKTVESEGNNSN